MKELKHWSVTVHVDGEDVLTIGHNWLTGADGLDDVAPAIRTAAAHLICFIGAGPDIVGGHVALASDAAQPDARAALDELRNIANAKRFDRETFADDTEFADWAQSRARYTIARASVPQATPIYQIGDGRVWWDVSKEEYERNVKARFMKTGIVYRAGE